MSWQLRSPLVRRAPAPAQGGPQLAEWDRAARLAGFAEWAKQDYALSSGAVERYRAAAASTQTAAAALGVLYTGALALVFGEVAGGLPARGLLTPAFLAAALAASTWYLSGSAPKPLLLPRVPALDDGDGVRDNTLKQLQQYRYRVSLMVLDRLWALRVATVALAVALFLAPAAFTQTPREGTLTPWPSAPSDASEAELALFEVQVAEVAEVRKAQQSARGEFWTTADYGWMVAAGVGVVLLGAAGFKTHRSGAKIRRRIRKAAAEAEAQARAKATAAAA